jgi:putative toxin-antitoxin system antitoxin component (TIGR02293 family)
MSKYSDTQKTPASVQLMAEAVFGSRKKALEWLESPIKALGGEVPRQLLHTPEGCEQVLQILKKLETGDFN